MFKYNNQIHNFDSPDILVPLFMKWFQPNSVVDVGCGKGFFLSLFHKSGVKVVGVEGEWCRNEELAEGVTHNDVIIHDLNKPLMLDRTFDLAICFEVAEHLRPESAVVLIESLCKLSSTVLFSAAIPGQTGQGHINEQWPDYWIEKFADYGFIAYDFIRPKIWDLDQVASWYKQNTLCFTNKPFTPPLSESFDCRRLVHPDAFEAQREYYKQIENGDRGTRYYLNILCRKYLSR